MNFKQFLLERDAEHKYGPYEVPEAIIKKIALQCQPFLEAADGDFLLRGMENMERCRTFPQPHNRKPLHSAAELGFNFAFNAMADSVTGIEDVRKNSLFCTNKFMSATEYGKVSFIFPMGKFEFLGARDISDSYVNTSTGINGITTAIYRHIPDFVSPPPSRFELTQSDLLGLFYDLEQRNVNTHDFMMLKCADEFHKILAGRGTEVTAERSFDLYRGVVKSLKLHGQDVYPKVSFSALLKSQYSVEIMITKSDGYIAVPYSIVEEDYFKTRTPEEYNHKMSVEDAYDFLLNKIAMSHS